MMFAHFIVCFLQYYQKTLSNHFSLVFHVASGIVSKTGTSTVYQFLWHFLFSVLIFQPLLCDWCYSELPAVIWRSLCQVKVSLKNRMGCSRLGVAHMEFILSGFPSLLGVSHYWHSSELTAPVQLLEPSWWTSVWMGLFIDTAFSSTLAYFFCCAVSVSLWDLGVKNHCLFLLP